MQVAMEEARWGSAVQKLRKLRICTTWSTSWFRTTRRRRPASTSFRMALQPNSSPRNKRPRLSRPGSTTIRLGWLGHRRKLLVDLFVVIPVQRSLAASCSSIIVDTNWRWLRHSLRNSSRTRSSCECGTLAKKWALAPKWTDLAHFGSAPKVLRVFLTYAVS